MWHARVFLKQKIIFLNSLGYLLAPGFGKVRTLQFSRDTFAISRAPLYWGDEAGRRGWIIEISNLEVD
jgi:hypothetical protein